MDEIKEDIKRITDRVFNNLLKATDQRSMALLSILFRPNNYRRKTQVFINDLKKESTCQKINTALLKSGDERKNSLNWEDKKIIKASLGTNKLLFIKFDNHVVIQIGKNDLVGIYNQMIGKKKAVFHIKGDTDQEIADNVKEKINEITSLIDKTIKDFCHRFDIRFDGNITKERYENWFRGDEFVEKLPKDMTIHETIFKKVYGKGLEFKGGEKEEPEDVYITNYIKHRTLDVPKVNKRLESTDEKIDKLTDAQIKTQEQLNDVIGVLKETRESNIFMMENEKTHFKVLNGIEKAVDKLAREVTKLRDPSNLFEDI